PPGRPDRRCGPTSRLAAIAPHRRPPARQYRRPAARSAMEPARRAPVHGGGAVLSKLMFVSCRRPFADVVHYPRAVLGGRNLMTLISAIRTKIANTTACVIAKGGSVCVGANAVRAETFTKLCTTKTKTLRYSDATAAIT